MFKKEITPRTAALATLIVLAVIQIVYWRLLVYRKPGAPRGGMGGGGGGPNLAVAMGREDVQVETLAGDQPGYRDGPGWQAQFCGPNALALAPDGSLLVADSRNHRIRRVSTRGRVTTVAGGGDPAGPGGMADGSTGQARFRYPSGVAVAMDGTIYTSDSGNHRICQIKEGQVTTLAGGQEGKRDGTGSRARFRLPATLTLAPDGALWVADVGNRMVRRVDAAGQVTTPASVPPAVREALGDFIPPRAHPAILASPEGNGSPAATSFTLGRQSSISLPPETPGAPAKRWMQVFGDFTYHTVLGRRGLNEPPLLLAGRRTAQSLSFGSSDGSGLRATFAVPCAVALAGPDSAYICDYEGNRIRWLRLPAWLAQGGQAPEQEALRPWRKYRGRRDTGSHQGL